MYKKVHLLGGRGWWAGLRGGGSLAVRLPYALVVTASMWLCPPASIPALQRALRHLRISSILGHDQSLAAAKQVITKSP